MINLIEKSSLFTNRNFCDLFFCFSWLHAHECATLDTLHELRKYISHFSFGLFIRFLISFLFVHRENHEQEKQSLNSIAENTVAMEVT